MIKQLLFDADGVLFAHTDRLFSERIIAEYGAERSSIVRFFEKIFPDCIIGKKDMKQELAAFLNEWHWPGTVEELMDYWYEYEHNIDQSLVEYVESLKNQGIISSVATNNDHYRAAWLFDNLNINASVFDTLYAAGDIGFAKPDLRFFQYILDDLPGVQPAEILFWDDSEQHLQAAKQLGLQVELYTTFNDFKNAMERYV